MRDTLFQLGRFTLASGLQSIWKMNCEFLMIEDWETLASIAAAILPAFGSVEGVPLGGLVFAEKLKKYITEGPLLIVDDVLTTGGSMEKLRNGREAIGIVAFARGVCPNWIKPLWMLNQ